MEPPKRPPPPKPAKGEAEHASQDVKIHFRPDVKENVVFENASDEAPAEKTPAERTPAKEESSTDATSSGTKTGTRKHRILDSSREAFSRRLTGLTGAVSSIIDDRRAKIEGAALAALDHSVPRRILRDGLPKIKFFRNQSRTSIDDQEIQHVVADEQSTSNSLSDSSESFNGSMTRSRSASFADLTRHRPESDSKLVKSITDHSLKSAAAEALDPLEASAAASAATPAELGAPIPETNSSQANASTSTARSEQRDIPLTRPKLYMTLFFTLTLLTLLPIPSYLSGLLTGLIFGAVAVHYFYDFYISKFYPSSSTEEKEIRTKDIVGSMLRIRREIPFRHDVHQGNDALFKIWVNVLPCPYNSESSVLNNVYSAFIILSGSKLQLLKPKNNIPKRAMWNEPEMKPTITSHVTVNIQGATLMTVPESLPARKRWNRRFPLYLEWSGEEMESKCIPTVSGDTENEHSERVVGSPMGKVMPPKGDRKMNAAADLIVNTGHGTKSVTIFTRTDRDKEELHRWLNKAIQPATDESKRPSPSESIGTDDSPPSETEPESSLRHRSPRSDKKQDDASSVDSDRTKRSEKSHSDLSDIPFHVSSLRSNDGFNLNFFLDRLFSEFLRDQNWREIVRKRIQKKLDLIKFPNFIDKLEASDLELGTSLPVIHRIAKPWVDSRGHWIELSITYSGGVKMTLETRINLMKLKKPEDVGTESAKPDDPENDEDELDAALHPLDSSDEEDAVGNDSEPASEEAAPSAKTKLVQYLTKFTESQYFQRVAEVGIVRRAMEGVSNTRLFLAVELKSLSGDLILNIPPHPTDRLWYGFKGNPTLWLVAKPKVGEREFTHTRITEFIEKRLILEFQKLLVLPNMDDMIIPILTAPQ